MIKYGEITSARATYATVRIYKGNVDSLAPTARTLNANLKTDVQIGDVVKLEINMLYWFVSTLFGYAFAFIASILAYSIASALTDNIIIVQSALFITLALTYLVASYFTKKPLFRSKGVCTVIEILE